VPRKARQQAPENERLYSNHPPMHVDMATSVRRKLGGFVGVPPALAGSD